MKKMHYYYSVFGYGGRGLCGALIENWQMTSDWKEVTCKRCKAVHRRERKEAGK